MIQILLFMFLGASLVIGQLFRVPVLGQSGGVLLSDLAVVLMLAFAYFKSLGAKNRKSIVIWLVFFVLFVVWSAFSLAVNAWNYTGEELAVAALYWGRTSAYLLLFPALFVIFTENKNRPVFKKVFGLTVIIFVVLGLLQTYLFPDLSELKGGWDPHQGRLVSTWLDPNFAGAFLAMGLFYFIGSIKNFRLIKVFLGALLVLAIVLTVSRSTLLALVVTLVVISPVFAMRLKKPAVLVSIGGLALTALLVASLFLGERAYGLLSYDPTVDLRAQSLKLVLPLAFENSLVGVGYNGFQFAALEEGLIGDFNINSRAGTDNSWLTLWATTGIFGMLLFILPWLSLARIFIIRWLDKNDGTALAAIASIVFLIVHSQFVNSFLYVHLLTALAIVTALALSEPVAED